MTPIDGRQEVGVEQIDHKSGLREYLADKWPIIVKEKDRIITVSDQELFKFMSIYLKDECEVDAAFPSGFSEDDKAKLAPIEFDIRRGNRIVRILVSKNWDIKYQIFDSNDEDEEVE